MPNSFVGNGKYFDEVVELYDKMRPTYVPELYQDIFNYKQIGRDSKVLEIGIGTGQATKPILETGCELTAIESGSNLATYVNEKYCEYQTFHVQNISFEKFTGEGNFYDLIFSATAFHWIPEEIGYKKVYQLLKSDGVFARFANNPSKDKKNEKLHRALQKLYGEFMPKSKAKEKRNFKEEAEEKANIAKKYGFTNTTYQLYERCRTFSSQEYIALLNTYSDHRALEEGKRREFFDLIKSEINRFGGVITVYDTIDLELARKA